MIETVEAFDKEGNKYVRTITIEEDRFKNDKDEYGYYGKIISFGWPVEYYINSLLRNYPLDRDLCIDMSGLNHKGSQVCIAKDDINKILAQFTDKD